MTSTRTLPPPSRRSRRWLLPTLAVAVVVAVGGLVAFQPWQLWVDKTVNEAAPAAAAPAPLGPPSSEVPSAATSATTVPPTTVPATTMPAPTVPATTVPGTAVTASTVPAAPAPATTVAATTVPAPPAEPAATELRSKAHDTSGTVRLLALEDGSRVLRIENLSTENGPDVKVVLSTDPDGYEGSGAVNLGTLKGNKGSQNYAVPADVDLSTLRSVVIWCKRFNVDFGVAALPGT